MINYEEDWLFPLLFKLQGSVYTRAAIFAIPTSALTFALIMLDRQWPEYRADSGLDTIGQSTIWSLSSTILIFLVGFRTRQALSRFWEGTGLLHQMKGEWFDTVSNCVTFTIGSKAENMKIMRFRHTIVRLMSLCHGSALEEISGMGTTMETIDVCGLSTPTLRHLRDCVENHQFNKVEVLLHLTQSLITSAHMDGVLVVPPPILSRVYQTISRGYVNLLNTKKITDTKFPFPYVQLITVLLLLVTTITPFVVSAVIDSLIVAPILAFIPVFGAHGLNFIAMELEDPFGEDDNDLPLAHFQAEMNNCLMMLLHPNTDVIASVNDNCIMDFHKLKNTVTVRDPCTIDHRETFRKKSMTLSNLAATFGQSSSSFDNGAHKGDAMGMTTSDSPISKKKLKEAEQAKADALQTRIDNMLALSEGSNTDYELPSAEVLPRVPGEGDQGRQLVASRTSAPSRLIDSVATALPEPGAPPKAEIDGYLSQSLEDFNKQLKTWTKTMEDQVRELSELLGTAQMSAKLAKQTQQSSSTTSVIHHTQEVREVLEVTHIGQRGDRSPPLR